MAEKSREKVLIVGPAWVGDMVMSQALYRALKEVNPETYISVLAQGGLKPLFERMPEVDEILQFDLRYGELKLGKRKRIGESLRKKNFNKAFILPLSFKSALVPWHAQIEERIGWRGEWRNVLLTDCRTLDKDAYPLMVQRFMSLAYPESDLPPKAILYPKLLPKSSHIDVEIHGINIEIEGDLLAIYPGAQFGGSKQWPADYYAEVVNMVLKNGWRVWVFGSFNDRSVTDSIMEKVDKRLRDRCIDLVGRTDLAEATDLLVFASVVLSNDSGLKHIAAALEKNVIGRYGSTSYDFTPPLSDKAELISTDTGCRPCFKRECPFVHLRCLTEIKPERVLGAIASFNSSA